VKLVFKTLKNYWIWPRCTWSMEIQIFFLYRWWQWHRCDKLIPLMKTVLQILFALPSMN